MLVAVKVVMPTDAIVWMLERKKIRARGRTTFGKGVAVPFVVLPPASRSWASAALDHSGCDFGVVATLSIPQGVCGSNHIHGCLVVSGTNRFSHGRRP